MFNLSTERDNPALRSELDKITRVFTGDEVSEQIPAIAALTSRFDHDISLEAEALPGDRRSWRYTCFQHAFELVDPPRLIIKIANCGEGVHINGEFVDFLTSNVLSAEAPEQVADGDVVVYSSNGSPKHAGKCRAERVVSKWGDFHLWRHRVLEVPMRYGSTVRFYRSISRQVSVEAFIEHATSKLGRTRIGRLWGAP